MTWCTLREMSAGVTADIGALGQGNEKLRFGGLVAIPLYNYFDHTAARATLECAGQLLSVRLDPTKRIIPPHWDNRRSDAARTPQGSPKKTRPTRRPTRGRRESGGMKLGQLKSLV
jgi:hypothetical protein